MHTSFLDAEETLLRLACTQITAQVTKHLADPILSSVAACCRYLYRHNYTISVPEVYYSVNRPDLQALYVDQLTQRDFSTQGSTDLWVKYLQTGRLLTQRFSRPAIALLTLLSSDAQLCCGKLLHSSTIAQCVSPLHSVWYLSMLMGCFWSIQGLLSTMPHASWHA